ncbi:hypothetical protein Mnod_1822 [Methylobacterium nodulans ORS 2060]|uniref:Uncharacterized protein n=1 Tax=Methylobacterium nodulans (strain LMG 21967 / CNCM I-2342 / ORS 2060) TaxID=460265 RepID=B8IS00_METNO|nr:hypothetical protein Mnod_1822 [Methylobacterium nodulans ORS 2060]
MLSERSRLGQPTPALNLMIAQDEAAGGIDVVDPVPPGNPIEKP